ncbi:hypothetical protein Syun_029728 [Stephania yunnanensis]|uniref:Uncharacterized protein n=1 Tax=Stephania yunnanensis TaxID=152371 RepID=A0AAP0E642_9MAGN
MEGLTHDLVINILKFDDVVEEPVGLTELEEGSLVILICRRSEAQLECSREPVPRCKLVVVVHPLITT